MADTHEHARPWIHGAKDAAAAAAGAEFVEKIRATLIDTDHSLYHNGNDHREPLPNCPRCAAQSLLAELVLLRARLDTAETLLRRIAEKCEDELVDPDDAAVFASQTARAFEDGKDLPAAAALCVEGTEGE